MDGASPCMQAGIANAVTARIWSDGFRSERTRAENGLAPLFCFLVYINSPRSLCAPQPSVVIPRKEFATIPRVVQAAPNDPAVATVHLPTKLYENCSIDGLWKGH
jgi:hypothetical protein